MALVNMQDLLGQAREDRYAIAALDVVSLDFVEAVVEAAEACRAPIIISLAESHFEHYDFELLMSAVVTAARRSTAPCAIHLDHGASLDSATRAIRFGCNGVMVDASHRPIAENLALTREIVALARGCGVAVEGELGYVPGVEGEDAERHPGDVVYTTPDEARTFVEETGVDCLAVSIGTIHGRMRGTPDLDLARLAEIADAVAVPLVIHGGTGLTDEQFRGLIERGVAKINYYTALADAAADAIRSAAAADPRAGYGRLTLAVRAAVRREAERVIRLFGSAGRADAVLTRCRPWREVEHLILFNADGDEASVRAMKDEGRRCLGVLPGVRQALTGEAVKPDARYRHCWLIRFSGEPVIAAYDHHPEHLAFADQRFRPVAGDRLKIDYELD
ncbi:ketose-bisphosphate aldolase [Thioalkalicoccus limnaeus]|uniref:Ketose-bisphosphate aldolase n=1 Tax=Thioalkalicoccus limnaeus TaxID=120681 RepID=A0ABV4BFH0_9GAMM